MFRFIWAQGPSPKIILPNKILTQIHGHCIFKIDCEGCEFSSFQSPENVQIVQKKVVQMQMEIHFGPNSLQQVSGLWFAMVNKFGMVPFHKEANIEFPMGEDGLALELAFLNQKYVKHEVQS